VHDFTPQPDAPFERADARLATDEELLLEGVHSGRYLDEVAARTQHAVKTRELHVLDEVLEGGGQGKDAEISAGYTATTERAARAAAGSLIDSAKVQTRAAPAQSRVVRTTPSARGSVMPTRHARYSALPGGTTCVRGAAVAPFPHPPHPCDVSLHRRRSSPASSTRRL